MINMEGRKTTVDMKKCLIGFIMGAAVFAASAGEPVVEFAEFRDYPGGWWPGES